MTRRHKTRNRVLTAVVLVLSLVLVMRLGPIVWRHCQVAHWKYMAQRHQDSSETVLFSYDVDRIPIYVEAPPLAYFNELDQTLWDDRRPALLHTRVAHRRTERLIWVRINSLPQSAGGLIGNFGPEVRVYEIGPWFSELKELYSARNVDSSIQVGDDKRLFVYAGQPDPKDESHFTIDVETKATRVTLDGWLQPDDSVHFELRPAVPIPTPTSSPASSQ